MSNVVLSLPGQWVKSTGFGSDWVRLVSGLSRQALGQIGLKSNLNMQYF